MIDLRNCFITSTLILSVVAHAQPRAVVWGRVTDAETGEPLEYTNVFLANTTIGTSTAADGNYRLTNVPAGGFDIVASRVGYGVATLRIDMASTDTIRQDFRLHSRTLEVGEVQVVVQDPVEWRRHLGKFTREFIGETDNARRCTILNPEVLSFRVDSSSNSLIAFSDSTLRIENSAFGYRIYVILDSFSWKLTEDLGRYNIYPRFEELQPRDADQAAAWAANRRKSYEGSFPHFLSALAAGQVDERGFAMYTSPMNPNMRHHVAPDELGRLIDKEGPISKMSFTGWLEVDYRGKGPSQKSYIRLNQQFALLDSAGVLLNPTCIEMVGQWSRYRVGDQLPFR